MTSPTISCRWTHGIEICRLSVRQLASMVVKKLACSDLVCIVIQANHKEIPTNVT